MAAFTCDFPADDLKPMCQVPGWLQKYSRLLSVEQSFKWMSEERLSKRTYTARLIHQDCEGRNRTGSKTDRTSGHSVMLSTT